MNNTKIKKRIGHSLETKEKIKKTLKEKGIKPITAGWNKGIPTPEKTLQKLRGKSPWNKGKKGVQKAWNKGKKCPYHTGPNNNKWKGGITPLNEKIRKSIEYKLWRESVFKRDDYTCIWCLKKGGILNADHIKTFAFYPELRFAIDNGRTLCEECHRKTDTYGFRAAAQG